MKEAIKKIIKQEIRAYFGLNYSMIVGHALRQPEKFYIDDRVNMTKAEKALLTMSASILNILKES